MPLQLLLLLTILPAAISLHLLNSPLSHSVITNCVTPGNTTQSTSLRCHSSCVLHLHRHLDSSTRTTFSLTSPQISKRFFFRGGNPHTEVLTLPKGSYQLTTRSHNPHHEDVCGLLTYAFQRQLDACPIVLPTVLAPSPTPSRTPSPSPRPSLPPTPPRNESSESPSGNPPSTLENVSETQVTPRIVGGNIPDATLRTHMVAFIVNGAFVCSGSMISSRWALTAAHCRIPRGATASIGGASVTSGTFRSVQASFPHSGFDFSNTDSPFDIALVLLDRAVPDDTTFIRVNTNASSPVPGAYARVAGYGDTLRRSITTLRQVDIPVVSMPRCKSNYARANPSIARRLDEELQLCAGLSEGGCDACQGDSGGPLAFFDPAGHLVQIGIVSFGIGCARAGFPGVHTRLSAFEPWIREIGAGFVRSTDGVTVFSTGSAEAAGLGGFSIAGLSTLQSILLLVGIAAVAGILLLLTAFSFVRRGRSRRTTPTMPPLPPQSQSPPPGPPQYHDTHGFGGFDPTSEQGLYPVYGTGYQYEGYTGAQPPTHPPPTYQPPIQPQPMQPPPVARDVQGGDVENPALTDQSAMSSLYPQNTVLPQ